MKTKHPLPGDFAMKFCSLIDPDFDDVYDDVVHGNNICPTPGTADTNEIKEAEHKWNQHHADSRRKSESEGKPAARKVC